MGFLLMPDFLFQVPYLILFWCLLRAMSEGIINLGGDFYIPTQPKRNIGSYIFFSVLFLYFAAQSALFTLYVAIGVMEVEALSQYISGFVTGLCSLVIILTLAMLVKSSGKPYKSTFYKKRVKTILIVILVWSFLKLVRGIAVLAGFEIL